MSSDIYYCSSSGNVEIFYSSPGFRRRHKNQCDKHCRTQAVLTVRVQYERLYGHESQGNDKGRQDGPEHQLEHSLFSKRRKHRAAEYREIEEESEPRNRNTRQRGVPAVQNLLAAACDGARNRLTSLHSQVQSVYQSQESEEDQRQCTPSHLPKVLSWLAMRSDRPSRFGKSGSTIPLMAKVGVPLTISLPLLTSARTRS